jgi:hypothetical protein
MCFPREPRDVSRCVPRHEVATLACMDVLISHNSAFALYDALDDATLAHRRTMPLESFGWDCASARTHPLVAALPQPLDVLVPFDARIETDTACLHASTQKLPPLSTLPLAPHLYTVAPEICLFQLARGARAIDIAQCASRLMSTYRTCSEAPSGIVERTQLTSPRKNRPLRTCNPSPVNKKRDAQRCVQSCDGMGFPRSRIPKGSSASIDLHRACAKRRIRTP